MSKIPTGKLPRPRVMIGELRKNLPEDFNRNPKKLPKPEMLTYNLPENINKNLMNLKSPKQIADEEAERLRLLAATGKANSTTTGDPATGAKVDRTV